MSEYPNEVRAERDDLRVRVRELEAEAERLKADSEQAWESRAHWCVEAGKAMKERDEARTELNESRKMHADLQRVIAERARETFKRSPCPRCGATRQDGQWCLCSM